jgi:hypothetical protein
MNEFRAVFRLRERTVLQPYPYGDLMVQGVCAKGLGIKTARSNAEYFICL